MTIGVRQEAKFVSLGLKSDFLEDRGQSLFTGPQEFPCQEDIKVDSFKHLKKTTNAVLFLINL